VLHYDASKVRNPAQRCSGCMHWVLGQFFGRVYRALPPHFYPFLAQIHPVYRAYSASSSHLCSLYSQHQSPSLSETGRQVPLQDFNIHLRKSVLAISLSRHLIHLRPARRTHSLATVQPTPFTLIELLATSPEGPHLPMKQGSAMTQIIPPNLSPHPGPRPPD